MKINKRVLSRFIVLVGVVVVLSVFIDRLGQYFYADMVPSTSAPFVSYEKVIQLDSSQKNYIHDLSLSGDKMMALAMWSSKGRNPSSPGSFHYHYQYNNKYLIGETDRSMWDDVELDGNEWMAQTHYCTCVSCDTFVYGLDFFTDDNVRPSDGLGNSSRPDISGNWAVYYRAHYIAGNPDKIMLSDKQAATHASIDSGSIYPAGPRISGNKVVWIENSGGVNSLAYYDINSKTKKILFSGLNNVQAQDIDIDGDNIALSDNGNLFVYNLATSQYSQLTYSTSPNVNYFSRVRIAGDNIAAIVYSAGLNNAAANTAVFNIPSRKLLFLSNSNASYTEDINGQRLVFADQRDPAVPNDIVYSIDGIGGLVNQFGTYVAPPQEIPKVDPTVPTVNPTTTLPSTPVAPETSKTTSKKKSSPKPVTVPSTSVKSNTTAAVPEVNSTTTSQIKNKPEEVIKLTGYFYGYNKNVTPKIRKSEKLVIAGKAAKQATVILRIDSLKVSEISADSKGEWKFILDAEKLRLKPGIYSINAESVCCNNRQSSLQLGKIIIRPNILTVVAEWAVIGVGIFMIGFGVYRLKKKNRSTKV